MDTRGTSKSKRLLLLVWMVANRPTNATQGGKSIFERKFSHLLINFLLPLESSPDGFRKEAKPAYSIIAVLAGPGIAIRQ